MSSPPVADVAQLLDMGRGSGYQRRLVALTALTIVFDGIDNQLMGVAIPTIMREWAVPRGAFAPVVSLGYLGMMAGGAIAGLVGDRLGRRTALLGSLFVFGVMTMAVAAVESVWTLGLLRFLTGLGLGGAIPNAAALSGGTCRSGTGRSRSPSPSCACRSVRRWPGSPRFPRSRRSAGARCSSSAAPLPVVAAVVLPWLLPESPRFLARFPIAGAS